MAHDDSVLIVDDDPAIRPFAASSGRRVVACASWSWQKNVLANTGQDRSNC